MACEYYEDCKERKGFSDLKSISSIGDSKKWIKYYCKREGKGCSTKIIKDKNKYGSWKDIELVGGVI